LDSPKKKKTVGLIGLAAAIIVFVLWLILAKSGYGFARSGSLSAVSIFCLIAMAAGLIVARIYLVGYFRDRMGEDLEKRYRKETEAYVAQRAAENHKKEKQSVPSEKSGTADHGKKQKKRN